MSELTSHTATAERAAHIVQHGIVTLNVMGPTIQLLTNPDGQDDAPAVMRGTIPPGACVPLHSHAEPETFVVVSGELDGFAPSAEGAGWVRMGPGKVFHVPGEARHAFRNRSQEPAVTIVVSTARMIRFFREIGTPVGPGATPPDPPSDDMIRHFLNTAARYGHWIASPEENAKIGLPVLSPAPAT
jgi:quercetin dioxygenase-like cupin family protein